MPNSVVLVMPENSSTVSTMFSRNESGFEVARFRIDCVLEIQHFGSDHVLVHYLCLSQCTLQ